MVRCVWSVLLGLPIAGPVLAGPDPYALAARIDEHLNRAMDAQGTVPAPRADDAEFLRRLTLDLVGRTPLTREVYDFSGSRDAHKDRATVERLLAAPGYSHHFTNVWRALLLPEATANYEVAYLAPGFESWLKQRFRDNTSYDRMARDLISVPIPSGRDGMNQQRYFLGGNVPNPMAFFAAKEAKPENIASATARVFLGVQIECAQCHNHPFARWSRDQFWNTAAFFAGIERQGESVFQPLREVADRRELAIPNSDRVVQAAFLDDAPPKWKFRTTPRVTFAEWMTAPDNPFFARTVVNRYWAMFFGTGIVDPVDDFNDENQPTHPELLEEMTQAFVSSGFDLHFLIKAITATEAYRRTSATTHPSQDDPKKFARMAVKAMTGEQLFDSLATAVGYRDPYRAQPFVAIGNPTPRSDFLAKFAAGNRRTESPTSILQALTLMNGSFVANASNLQNGETLAAVAQAPFLDTPGKVKALYVAVLGRTPSPEESRRLVAYVETGPKDEANKRLGDVMWTLLNTVEFRVNH